MLHHARCCKCSGTPVVPLWSSAPFWPLLYSEVSHGFAGFVIGRIVFPSIPGIVRSGLLDASLFRSGMPNSEILALRCQW